MPQPPAPLSSSRPPPRPLHHHHNHLKSLLRQSFTSFFYLWYGTPTHDQGLYLHWNHYVLPHWTPTVNQHHADQIHKYHSPHLGHIHAPFFPERGLYSSRDPAVLRSQFHEMTDAGINLVAVSWWGQASSEASGDTQGVSTDALIPLVLEAAEDVRKQQLQKLAATQAQADTDTHTNENQLLHIAFHLEPYPGRSIDSVREDLAYIHKHYGNSSAFVPIFYVYDSYHIPTLEWANLLTEQGNISIRNTELDGLFIGLWLERQHGKELVEGGFDAFYTYFASRAFSWGSTVENWGEMVAFAREQAGGGDRGRRRGEEEDKGTAAGGVRDFLSILSVGPGYDDTKIRPWNGHNTKARRGTKYFDEMFAAAQAAGPDAMSITSFNEWGEGTQIEPAKSDGWKCEATWEGNATHLSVKPYVYEEYDGGDSFLYMKRVRYWKGKMWDGEGEGGREEL